MRASRFNSHLVAQLPEIMSPGKHQFSPRIGFIEFAGAVDVLGIRRINRILVRICDERTV